MVTLGVSIFLVLLKFLLYAFNNYFDNFIQAIAGVSRILYDEENALKESSREVKNNGSTYADAVSNIHNSAGMHEIINCIQSQEIKDE